MQFDERCYSTFEQLGPGMHQKNRNAPNSPYLSLRPSQTLLMISSFVLVSSLGWSGNRQIPDHPRLSQQLKTRTKDAKKIPNETTGHPVLEAHKANYRQIYTLCLINIYFSLHVSDYANKIKTQNTERA